MQMNQLRYVEAAARHGSFSRAAQELYIAQPSLSQQIRALENELGTPLFYRHSKSVSLTEAGKEFYEYACRILNDTEQIEIRMQSYQKLELGRLRLGVFWLFSYLNLADPIQRFSQTHPNLDLRLRLEDSEKLFQMLIRHELDAAILICTEQIRKSPEFYFRLIHKDRMCIIVHQMNPLSRRNQLTIQDLEGENVILPSAGSPLHSQVVRLIQQENVQLHIVCESSHNDINAQMVSQNLAVSFSSASVAEVLNTGVYEIIPFKPDLWREVYFATPRHCLADPVIREFIGYI